MDKGATLSGYIIAFAGAASSAQKIMSTGTDPMVIKEFKFKINITADTNFTSETDVSFSIWRISLEQKLKYSYAEHMGITVECAIVPVVALKQKVEAVGSGSGSENTQ
ncbi:hypothetical protein ACFX5K_06125 [Rickettsiales bacterium LUAb2]